MQVANRAAALRARLADEDVAVLVLTQVVNVRYTTGFDGVFDDDAAHVALISAHQLLLYTDSRYYDAASAAAKESDWEVIKASGDVLAQACSDLNREGVESLAFESSLPFARHKGLVECFGGECTPATNWVEGLRTVKDASEIARIEAAQVLTDRAFEFIVNAMRPGLSERDIALELEFFLRKEGSEGVAFPPIVASGPNSALPHAIPGARELATGDFVVLDFGARVGGYCSDMTRTVVVGRPSEEQREIYDTVLRANLAGAEAVQAGRAGSEIDAIARAVIVSAGYGDWFGHGLGHGVGLEVHEQPGLGSRSSAPVPLGSVVTIEPGIYIPGMGGVRIEDLAVVEQRGARVLTASTKDLLEV